MFRLSSFKVNLNVIVNCSNLILQRYTTTQFLEFDEFKMLNIV